MPIRRRYSRPAIVYFVGDGTFVKIGMAVDAAARLRALQVHCPQDLELYGVCAGGRAQEAAFHREFAEYRVRNEWFRMEGRLREFLDRVYFNPPNPVEVSGETGRETGRFTETEPTDTNLSL